MQVWRPHPVGRRRIGAGLDCFETVAAFRVGVLDGEALEVGIQRRGIRVARVRVAAMRVRLPELDARTTDGLPLDVEDPAHHVNDLTGGAPRLARNDGEIGALVHALDDGIERTEDLAGRPLQRLGEGCAESSRDGETSGADGKAQHLSPRDGVRRHDALLTGTIGPARETTEAPEPNTGA